MAEKTIYKTQHKEELLSYLSTCPGMHFTVSDLVSHFREEGKPIGTTTVYRQLERLCEKGVVNKYIIDQNSPACFEYVGEGERRRKSIPVFIASAMSAGR